MKQLPLSTWGGIFIFGGVFAGLAMMLMVEGRGLSRAEKDAARLGGMVAGGLLVLVGVALIVLHFVRRRRG